MTAPRVLFAGTPAFALASLDALLDAGYVPAAVLTQPDRPAGRGKKLTPGPVKLRAREAGIPVLQPATLKSAELQATLAGYAADLMIVAAYGLLLPQAVLDLPATACVNVHASLLPRWRGAAPIQAAILAGDAKTGISLMRMTAGLDSGPVYARRALPITAATRAGELHDALAVLGGELLVECLPAILAGEMAATPQDDSAATYAPKIGSADAELDWREPAALLDRKVRAYDPVPGAWFMLDGERIKCWRASPVPTAAGAPGTVSTDAGLVVACGNGGLRLERLQRPGKRPVAADEVASQLGMAGRVLPPPAAPA